MHVFKRLVFFISSAMLVVPQIVTAAYPEKPIKMYIAFGAGGSTDSMSRIIAKEVEQILDQQIVPINKTGGGGTVCMGLLASEKPDGYTIASALTAQLNRIPLQRKTTYKPLSDFTPIFSYANAPGGIVTYKGSEFKNLNDLIEFAKKNPGKIKYGVGGAGTTLDVTMRLIENQTGFKSVSIPFKGSKEAMTALMGKHVDIAVAGPAFVSMHLSGQIHALAVQNDERLSQIPDIPTLGELGINVPLKTFFTFYAPAGLPSDQLAILENAFEKAVKTESVKKALEKYSLAPVIMKNAELVKYLEQAWPEEEKILKELGIIQKAATSPR